jgi:hypothetical protein
VKRTAHDAIKLQSLWHGNNLEVKFDERGGVVSKLREPGSVGSRPALPERIDRSVACALVPPTRVRVFRAEMGCDRRPVPLVADRL